MKIEDLKNAERELEASSVKPDAAGMVTLPTVPIWHNLISADPGLDRLGIGALAAACPHGWIEIRVHAYPADAPQTEGPHERIYRLGKPSIIVERCWGVDSHVLKPLLKTLDPDWPGFAAVPDKAVVIGRVEEGPGGAGYRECDQCELRPVIDQNGNDWRAYDVEGASCPLHYLDDGSCDGVIRTARWVNVAWGIDGKPVHSDPPRWLRGAL